MINYIPHLHDNCQYPEANKVWNRQQRNFWLLISSKYSHIQRIVIWKLFLFFKYFLHGRHAILSRSRIANFVYIFCMPTCYKCYICTGLALEEHRSWPLIRFDWLSLLKLSLFAYPYICIMHEIDWDRYHLSYLGHYLITTSHAFTLAKPEAGYCFLLKLEYYSSENLLN